MLYECMENHAKEDKFHDRDVICRYEIYLEKVFQKSIVRKSMQDAYHTIGFNNNSQKSSIGFGSNYLTIRDGERFVESSINDLINNFFKDLLMFLYLFSISSRSIPIFQNAHYHH